MPNGSGKYLRVCTDDEDADSSIINMGAGDGEPVVDELQNTNSQEEEGNEQRELNDVHAMLTEGATTSTTTNPPQS